MSVGFLLPNPDEAVIWRGPKKNGQHLCIFAVAEHISLVAGLIKQFLKDVDWGDLDYLVCCIMQIAMIVVFIVIIAVVITLFSRQVIDTPPGTSDEHLSLAQYLATCQISGAVIITTPQVCNACIVPNRMALFVYLSYFRK